MRSIVKTSLVALAISVAPQMANAETVINPPLRGV